MGLIAGALFLSLAFVSSTAIVLRGDAIAILGGGLIVVAAIAAELYFRLQQTTRSLAQASATDSPTGVLTADAFAHSAELCEQGLIVKVEIDDLEEIATTHGRSTANAVLSHVANVICASVREDDPVGRMADDSFAILLGDVEHEVAQRICSRLEASIASSPYSGQQLIIELFAHANMQTRHVWQQAA